MNRKAKIFSFVIAIMILFSSIGTPALAAPSPVVPGVAIAGTVNPVIDYAAGCQGRRQYTSNKNGYFIWLNSCDVKNLGDYKWVTTLLAGLIPYKPAAVVAAIILNANFLRIKNADKGRGVILFQYWWALRLPFPINTWTWAITAQ